MSVLDGRRINLQFECSEIAIYPAIQQIFVSYVDVLPDIISFI